MTLNFLLLTARPCKSLRALQCATFIFGGNVPSAGKENILGRNRNLWKLEDQFQTNKQALGVGCIFFPLYHLQCHLKLAGLFLSIPKHKRVKNLLKINVLLEMVTQLQENIVFYVT